MDPSPGAADFALVAFAESKNPGFQRRLLSAKSFFSFSSSLKYSHK
jgi:hypothetical protein